MRKRLASIKLSPVLLAFLTLLTLSPDGYSLTVNRLNGGANIIYIDFSVPGSVLPLELVRSYNSITAVSENNGWKGALGWGWTSPFETTLTVTPDRSVLLRDGATGNTLRFGPEKEDPKVISNFVEAVKKSYFERQQGKKLRKSDLTSLQLPDKILSRLKVDAAFRTELAAKYGLEASEPAEGLLISREFGYQSIRFRNNEWERRKGGLIQTFDNLGRLTRQVDKNGYYFTFSYSKKNPRQLTEITSKDRALRLAFTWNQDQVSQIADNRGLTASYSYDQTGNLIQVTDSTNQTYVYKYSNPKFPHLLTKIEYPSESKPGNLVYREVSYDRNGLVTVHREKDGTENQFIYGKSATDPQNNFWTKTISKKSGEKSERYDEFYLRKRRDGSSYLYKQATRDDSKKITTLYSSCCGTPLEINDNGRVTKFKYYTDGLLRSKISPEETIKLEYDPRWKKISKVQQNDLISEYQYDNRGNLVGASNNRNVKISLKYDNVGRIEQMSSKEKIVNFKYGNQGKPTIISQKGVGTIKIQYDSSGRIVNTSTVSPEAGRVPSQANTRLIVRKVMQGFQDLLDVIRPAGVGFSNG